MSVILYSGWYSTPLCRRHPELIFVFGDNLLGFGKGGQAIIRDEPNAFGVPTKRKPAMSPGSFFTEGNEADMDSVLKALEELWNMLSEGKMVVFPINAAGEISLGLERAELKERAPTIYEAITRHVGEMGNSYGVTAVGDTLTIAGQGE